MLDSNTAHEKQIAFTNTGKHDGWYYKAIQLRNVVQVSSGNHVLQVYLSELKAKIKPRK